MFAGDPEALFSTCHNRCCSQFATHSKNALYERVYMGARGATFATDVAEVAQVWQLREILKAEAGIPDLECDIVDPAVPGFAKLAADIFHRDGFCIVKVWQSITT